MKDTCFTHFLSYRKLRLLYDKSLRHDALLRCHFGRCRSEVHRTSCTSREDVVCRKRPRSARECAEAHSFLSYRKLQLLYNNASRESISRGHDVTVRGLDNKGNMVTVKVLNSYEICNDSW